MVLSRRRFRGVTPFVAMVAAAVCACHCVLSLADKYHRAQYRLNLCEQELQGWEACRVAKPVFFRENAEAVSNCLRDLAKAKDDFWASLGTGQLAGLYVLAGLAGAVGGCLVTWAIFKFAGLAVGKFIWFWARVFRPDTGEQAETQGYMHPS